MSKSPGSRSENGSEGSEGPSEMLTMAEAIQRLKTTRPTFYRWVRSGQLRGMKVGRQWRFTREEVERFLTGQGSQPDLPVGIEPLIDQLRARLAERGVEVASRDDQDDLALAVDLMIRLAVAMRASDLHLDAQRESAPLRLRVDGVLHVVARFDPRLMPAVVERWKSLAGMNVLEKAVPQDGRFARDIDGEKIDLRVCSLPACLGESIVARFARMDVALLDLARLPYADADRRRLVRCLAAPSGMIVVTGPVGCGKTTTLYAAVQTFDGGTTKVLAVEDPVECLLPGVTQVATNAKAGVTFERVLRSFMRADPDVIMVSEIRSLETMQMSLAAAMTGHLVLTSMHTDEAASALRRMVDVGCDIFVIAEAVRLVVAQRLVRKLCPHCSEESEPGADQLALAQSLATAGGVDWTALPRQYRQPVGCDRCGGRGYVGRTLIAETLEVTAPIAGAVRRNASASEIRALAVEQGMTTLAADGIRRAAEGQVALSEVLHFAAGISGGRPNGTAKAP